MILDTTIWAVVASGIAAYAYLIWRTTQRWNMLLRRAGKTPDDDALRKTSKTLGFVLSEQHTAFHDAKLSQLVRRARLALVLVVVGFVLLAATDAIVF
jgi:hypothetical protein